MAREMALVGSSYNIDNQIAEVVAIDDHSGTIEIQYLNGNLDEYTPSDWYRLNPVKCNAYFSASDALDGHDIFDTDEHFADLDSFLDSEESASSIMDWPEPPPE